MVRLYILSLSILTSLLLLTSCEKDEEPKFTTETVDATLLWSGDYAVDGCGFILRVGEAEYKPLNEEAIPESYKDSSPTQVEANIINYHREDPVMCGFAGSKMKSIKVVSLHTK